ncbi:dTDP-4-dehydrorhamnose reductase [Hanstruepera marina]|uniref:dTDP-4-dehydrorhamnose reductase n=1 Tax=Hanstruepera marina TaxID=2873265 RepID=UPI001CA67A16|nr:dTDP-4-dehydrorhamnose reductase [Hanstruepera marina]
MNKKILVTGSDGQLGKSIQKLVEENKYNLDFVFANKDLLDITKEKELEVFFKENTFDYCINCAAYTAVDKAEEEEEKAFLINAESVRLLAINCKEHNTILVHVSTDFVFDGLKKEPYIETDAVNPINVYGASKLLGEKFAQDILDKYYIIRTSWVYSEFGNNFVKTMLRLSKETNKITVVDDQVGCPTYALDLAQAILEIIKSDPQKFGIYHFSNSGSISWFEFAKAIIQEIKSECQVKPIPSDAYPVKAKRPSYSVLDKEKTIKCLNLRISDWKERLNDLVSILD